MAPRKHNTQTPRDRQKLVEDFEDRVQYTRETGDLRNLLERPRSLAWVVHPLADETALLAELGVAPENCLWTDAYWRFGGSVYFVQVVSSTPPMVYRDGKPIGPAAPYSRRPGIYYRFDKDLRQDDFDIFLPGPVVTSADLHHVFHLLEQIIDSGRIELERAAVQDNGDQWLIRAGPIVDLS